MKPRLQASRAAIDLVERFEGYRRAAGQLADGRWTIGYGHTKTAREGAEVSESDAEALLIYDLMEVAAALGGLVYTPLTQNQFDALCAFVFNIGIENFRHSNVLRRINEGDLLRAACAMEMWRRSDFEGAPIVIDALVRRRAAEKALFLTPSDGFLPAPTPILPPSIDQDLTSAMPSQTPVEVKSSLEGDAVAERVHPPEPPQSASEIASAAVTARLQSILSEEEPPPPSAPEPAAAPPEPPLDAVDLPPPVVEAAPPEPEPEPEPELEPLNLTPPPPEAPTPFEVPEPAEPLAAEGQPELFAAAPMTFEDFEQARPTNADDSLGQVPNFDEPVEPMRLVGVVPGLLGLLALGLVVFAGALFWAINVKHTGTGLFSNPWVIGWGLGIVGIGCVASAVYFLLERLGGREEP
ncbi:MAG: lysozyme [Caulobacteraceae bacterium]